MLCFLETPERMNSKTFLAPKFVAAASIILALFVFGFFSNEARKEVYFLCGNFKQGVTYSSVIRQLETTNLSSYKIEATEMGKRIVHSSALHFHLLRCSINFNSQEVVISASYG